MRGSPKSVKIVEECRGLTVDRDGNLIARAFPRFYNLGEMAEQQKDFIWEGCTTTNKEDGSLIKIYYWDNEWRINTREGFGEGNVGDGPYSWRRLVEETLPDGWQDMLCEEFTYVGEFCSVYNKIVNEYKQKQFFLLTIFQGEQELSQSAVSNIATLCDLDYPIAYDFSDADSVVAFITDEGDKNHTWKGVVLRDRNNMRIKVSRLM
jgi:RNA ligase